MLRPTPAYCDLPDVSEGELPRSSDLDLEDQTTGLILHRYANANSELSLKIINLIFRPL